MRHILQGLSTALMYYKVPAKFYYSGAIYQTTPYLHGQRCFKVSDTLCAPESRFADPTYDDTFRRLFGEETNKEILINALNSFLGFTGTKAIVDVEINNPALEKRKVFQPNPSISGAIDILCTTTTNQKIAVEMQGKKKPYFLAREQEYMAKLISGQVKDGEGERYHDKVLDTYIIVISKTNIFTGDTALRDQKLYEVDVVPTVQQTQEVYPGNKMHWKFFELQKFKKHQDSKDITKGSPLKFQWLDFLLSCPVQKDVPEDRDDIIKQGYSIMDMMTWDPDERTIHWRHIANQRDGELLLAESREKGRAEEKVKILLAAIQKGLDHETLSSIFHTLQESDLTKAEKYIAEHKQCTTDELAQHIGLPGAASESPEDPM